MAEIGIMKKLTIGGSTYTIPEYNLPIASDSTLGGVKIGTGLSINSTTGVLSATGLDYDEADPVFAASAAYGITQNDIDSWNAKVSDTKTWGDVVAPSSRGDTEDARYIPQFSATSSTSGTTATFALTRVEPFAKGVPKWDANKYLYAATPSASDNSTKVATTAYVDGAISQKISGVLTYKGTKASVADVIAISNPSTGDVWNVTADGSEYAYDGSTWQELGTAVDLSGYVTTSDSRLSDARTPLAHNQALSTITGADDLKAIEALTGTSGLLKKTAANTWTLDTNTYLTSYTETDPTVPSWAKAETKPTYTASEVGALPSTTVIPSKTSDLTNDSGFITSYTDEKMKWTASTSSNTYYPLQSTSTATTSTANTLNSISFYQYYNTAGGYRRLILGNTTAWKSSGGAYGTIRLYGAAATYYGDLIPGVLGTTSNDGHLTANRTWTLPDKTGTVALTSDIPTVSYPVISVNTKTGAVVLTASDVGALPDTTVIPTVPTNVSAFTNDAGYITSADVPEGASAYTGTISAVTSGNASAGSNNGFARGDHVHNITKTTVDTVLGTGSGTAKFYREDGTWATPAYKTSATNSATGITASTTANKTTVGSSSTDYGVTAAGSGSFSATVTSHVLSFSHGHTAPTLGSKVPTVSTTSATVTITDNGHTHTLS